MLPLCQTLLKYSEEASTIFHSQLRALRPLDLLRVAPLFLATLLAPVVLSQQLPAQAQQPAPVQAPAVAQAPAEPRVTASAPGFGYWAPELRELHLRVPLKARAIGGDEMFRPGRVTVNGERVPYSYWYFDGVTFDYADMPHASRNKIEAFIPYPWKAGQEYSVKLEYSYGGENGDITVIARAPQGGVWAPSDGGNFGFQVREEAGLARNNEPVDFDVTLPTARFAKPDETVRATIMPRPGVFQEIDCQVYSVGYSSAANSDGDPRTVRFRVAVQLTMAPRSQTIVFLWHCPATSEKPGFEPGLRVEGTALGGTVENSLYKIKLDDRSGQLLNWEDKRLKTSFYGWGEPKDMHPMHYTPDVYRAGSPWSHAEDWRQPAAHEVRGPLFYESTRLGPMPGAPELEARATYRFFANRPEVRSSSVLRVVKDVDVKAFRNGGMIQQGGLFTHAAWLQPDGTIKRMPVTALGGNDTGSPPAGRMPWNTPWVAFYNTQTKIGIALMTTNLSFFHLGTDHPNMSNAMYYVSFYRGRFLYTLRALNINYSANIRTYLSPMTAGSTTYEEMVMLPFSFTGEDARQFAPVETLRKELLNPLVITP